MFIYNKYLYDDNRFNYPLEKLIEKTNLNIKDKYSNTILHYLILSNDWIKFKNILIFKKNDIFILNSENKTVLLSCWPRRELLTLTPQKRMARHRQVVKNFYKVHKSRIRRKL